jgi:hypothetical protein
MDDINTSWGMGAVPNKEKFKSSKLPFQLVGCVEIAGLGNGRRSAFPIKVHLATRKFDHGSHT